MKHIVFILLVAGIFINVSCSVKTKNKSSEQKITFAENEADKKIDVLVDGKLFTCFQWPYNICKPVLYPILTSAGTEISRGFPVNPKPGERADHPHQIGMWLTYGNVNGNDFWGNGSQGLGTKNSNGGVIKHFSMDKISEDEGVLVTSESWTDTTGTELLKEKTEYHFIARDSLRIIDRVTTLHAVKEVVMPDTKEGMFGIRVARQLELPSEGMVSVVGKDGEPVREEQLTNGEITGDYISSEGITGKEVWGTRAKWMDLFGNIGDEKISIVICDHPDNMSYPTWWHARDYGLFSANPLGAKDFTQGQEQVNFSLPAGGSVTFRYRVIISSGTHLSVDEINKLSDDFSNKYR